MNFLSPERLWLLIPVIGFIVAYVALQSRRRHYAVKFTNIQLLDRVAPRRPGYRRHVPAALFLSAIGVLVVGFAQPTAEQRVPRERATIMIAIDTSLSMEATDVAPSRIDAAKAAASSFVDMLPEKLNVGLVLFNGNATLRVPPTTDRDAVKRGIADAKLGEKTAIGEAIFASLDAINTAPPDAQGTPPPGRIVLMSDGTTNSGRSNDSAAEAAAEAGVPVATIAFGTDAGSIVDPNSGAPVSVPVDRVSLEVIADATEGRFYEAASEGELRDVYDDIGSSVGYVTEQQEVSSWFIGGALLLLLGTAGLSLAWFSRLP